MQRIAALSLVTLVGCATSQTPPSTTPETQTVRVSGVTGSTGLRTTSSTMSRVDTLWVSLDRVWKALPGVYGTLDIPIERFDAESNTIGHSSLKLYRRLGKVPLTRYLDCGATQIGPNADSYEVYLSVLTKVQRVQSDSANTAVMTTVEATARPVQFRGDMVRCTSKGALEERVLDVMKVQLAP